MSPLKWSLTNTNTYIPGYGIIIRLYPDFHIPQTGFVKPQNFVNTGGFKYPYYELTNLIASSNNSLFDLIKAFTSSIWTFAC